MKGKPRFTCQKDRNEKKVVRTLCLKAKNAPPPDDASDAEAETAEPDEEGDETTAAGGGDPDATTDASGGDPDATTAAGDDGPTDAPVSLEQLFKILEALVGALFGGK